jgi:hypothetical protein
MRSDAEYDWRVHCVLTALGFLDHHKNMNAMTNEDVAYEEATDI